MTPLQPDAIFVNAHVITLDPRERCVQALAVLQGRIVASRSFQMTEREEAGR